MGTTRGGCLQPTVTWIAGLALFLPTIALADCPSTLQTLDEDVGVAMDAMSRRGPNGALMPDMAALGAAKASAAVHIDCLSEPLTPEAAAAWHRLGGMAAAQAGDSDAALLHFRAATAADKSFILPMTMAPRGSALRTLYTTALTKPPPQLGAVEVPDGHELVVDGVRSSERPVGLPVVLQLLDFNGRVVSTHIVEAGDELPAWRTAAPAVAEAEPVAATDTEPAAEPAAEPTAEPTAASEAQPTAEPDADTPGDVDPGTESTADAVADAVDAEDPADAGPDDASEPQDAAPEDASDASAASAADSPDPTDAAADAEPVEGAPVPVPDGTDPWAPVVQPDDGVVDGPVDDPWSTGATDIEPVTLPDPPEKNGVNVPLLGAAGATAVLGGVLYGVALGTEAQFKDTSVQRDDTELDAMRGRANTLGYAGQGLGVVALGLAGMSFAVSF